MDGLDPRFRHRRILAFPVGNAPLAALQGEPSASRFHGWRGETGRRYVTTVHAVDRTCADAGLPDLDAFVLVAAHRTGATARPLVIAAIEQVTHRRAAISQALAAGATEWHVHLLAAGRRDRAMVVADLNRRHGEPVMLAARSA